MYIRMTNILLLTTFTNNYSSPVLSHYAFVTFVKLLQVLDQQPSVRSW